MQKDAPASFFRRIMKKVITITLIICIVIGVCTVYSINKMSREVNQEPAAVTKQKKLVTRSKASIENVMIGKVFARIYIPVIRKRVPCVIIANGYTATYKDYEPIARRLYKKGIACAVFDFRYGAKDSRSGGDMTKMTAATLKTDLRNVLNYMKEQDYVNLKKIYLAGHSQGGLITALVANHRNDLAGLFLVAPAFNIPQLLKFDRAKKTLTIGNGVMSSAYIKSMQKVNLYKDIEDFSKPVYIFQGTSDTTVPEQYAKTAVKHYKKGHLVRYAGQGHVFDDAAIEKMVKKLLA